MNFKRRLFLKKGLTGLYAIYGYSFFLQYAYAQNQSKSLSSEFLINGFGMALIPIHSSEDLKKWQSLFRKLPAEKFYWLRLFETNLNIEKANFEKTPGKNNLKAFENSIIKIQRTSVNRNFNQFLDILYKMVSEDIHFMNLIYPSGTFRAGFADPDFINKRKLP